MTGLAAAVKIGAPEAANDLLNVNGLDGNDTISGAVGLAALIKVGIDGGAGNDTINGGDGAEKPASAATATTRSTETGATHGADGRRR